VIHNDTRSTKRQKQIYLFDTLLKRIMRTPNKFTKLLYVLVAGVTNRPSFFLFCAVIQNVKETSNATLRVCVCVCVCV
jgi:hypothetical protein